MIMNMSNISTTAADVVLRDSHVLLDSGRCHHALALQNAVAAKVSGEKKIVEN